MRSFPVGRLAATMCATGLLLATAAQAQGRPELVDASLRNPAMKYVAAELLVQFKAGHSDVDKVGALARVGAQVASTLRRDAKGTLQKLRLPAGASVPEAIRALRGQAGIDFVEPNWIYTRQAALNPDPYYADGSLWGMYGDASQLQTNAYGSQAAEAWAKGNTCSGKVLVGIIDEGMMKDHPDTQANVWTNPFEIPDNGIDDDGNGYVDDTQGWDFRGKDNRTFDGTGDDHGTHVSGTIGARGNDGVGVAGMCWRVKMVNAKFLGGFFGSGSTENAILAVDYLTDLKTRHGLNLVATNNSWGGGGFSQGLKDAIDRAGAADILFVAAAGNNGSNTDATLYYPQGYDSPNVISVASITRSGTLSSFSNYGATTVDLGAPGSDIWSTVPKKSGDTVIGGYASYDGTSMATPHVTGAVAMYASMHPGATAAEIKAAILAATTPTPSLAGKTVTGGRLDVSKF
jgi:Subtilase family